MTDSDRAWIAYSAPITVFGVLTAAEGYFPPTLYPLAYAIKIAGVTLALLIWRAPLQDIRPTWSSVIPSAIVGLVVIVVWIGFEELVTYPHLGDRTGFDPFTIESRSGRLAFLAVRLYGLILVVPVMEELFWRSFVLRFASQQDFQSLAIGQFSSTGLAVMVAVSAAAHTEWIVAAITSLVLALWLRRTRSLFTVIVAHSVANAALGAWVLNGQHWRYW